MVSTSTKPSTKLSNQNPLPTDSKKKRGGGRKGKKPNKTRPRIQLAPWEGRERGPRVGAPAPNPLESRAGSPGPSGVEGVRAACQPPARERAGKARRGFAHGPMSPHFDAWEPWARLGALEAVF